MKIKLSKAQWEEVGKKSGWIKKAETSPVQREVCKQCKGRRGFTKK